MNLTIANGKLSTGKSVKAQYLASACALALAATALVGIGTWRDAGPAAVAAKHPALNVAPQGHFEAAPKLYFVIAGSELQANDHRSSVMQDFNPQSGISFSHFVVTNAAEEAEVMALADAASPELAGADTAVWIVDLRQPTVVSPVSPSKASAWSSGSSQTVSGPQVAFILVADKETAGRAHAYEEMAQWIRHDNLVPEPNRSAIILIAGRPEERARAQSLMDDAMAAANFSESNPAPHFTVVDLR